MGDSHVGLQARLMSQALRKLTGAPQQLQHHRDLHQPAPREDRRHVRLLVLRHPGHAGRRHAGEDRQDRQPEAAGRGAVLRPGPAARSCRKKVVNWFDNGPTEHFLQFTVAHVRAATAGRSSRRTANHLIRTPGRLARGRRADRRRSGACWPRPHRLSDQQWQVVLGWSDGRRQPLAEPVASGHGARFRMGHGAKQADYLDWKASLLGNIGSQPTRRTPRARSSSTSRRCPSSPSCARPSTSATARSTCSWDYLKALTPLALAVWYMDDGCFTLRSKGLQARTAGGSGRIEICVEAMSPGTRERLVEYLRRHVGLDVEAHGRAAPGRWRCSQFTTAATAKFHELVAPFVHPSMEYKLLPRFRGQFAVEPEFVEPPSCAWCRRAILDVARQAADPVDAPVRHRGRGHPQLLRRRRHGAQQPGDHDRWARR